MIAAFEPGHLYELTEDVKNPNPDRRRPNAFAHLPVWRKGTVFVANEIALDVVAGGAHYDNTIWRRSPSEAVLQPFCVERIPQGVHETLSAVFRSSSRSYNTAVDVLEALVASKTITLEDVRRAAVTYRETP